MCVEEFRAEASGGNSFGKLQRARPIWLDEDEKVVKPVQDGLAKGTIKIGLKEHEFVKRKFVANVPFLVENGCFAPTMGHPQVSPNLLPRFGTTTFVVNGSFLRQGAHKKCERKPDTPYVLSGPQPEQATKS